MYDCTVVREESIEKSYINIITVIWYYGDVDDDGEKDYNDDDDSGVDDYYDDKENFTTKLAWEEKMDRRTTWQRMKKLNHESSILLALSKWKLLNSQSVWCVNIL